MSLPYLPLFIDDYDAATAHLTPAEDGIYCRLLRLCWRSPQCDIPDDPTWIARHLRISIEDFHTVAKPVISEFFATKNGRIFQKRLLAEWECAKEKHSNRVKAGKKGGRPAKPLKTNETGKSNAKAMRKQSLSNHNHNQIGSTREPIRGRGTRLSPDWSPSTEHVQFAVGEGLSFEAAHREAHKFRDYWISQPGQRGVKTDWMATWRNWVRKSQERAPQRKQHHNHDIIASFARAAEGDE